MIFFHFIYKAIIEISGTYFLMVSRQNSETIKIQILSRCTLAEAEY